MDNTSYSMVNIIKLINYIKCVLIFLVLIFELYNYLILNMFFYFPKHVLFMSFSHEFMF